MKQKVYISHSLLDTLNTLKCLVEYFERQGFIVNYYKKGDLYSDKNVVEANFIVFIPYLYPYKKGHNLFETYVGKRQFTEYKLAKKLKIPTFMSHACWWNDVEPTLGFIDVSTITAAKVNDENDWKKKYGIFRSRERCVRSFFPTVKETNKKLLLILNNG